MKKSELNDFKKSGLLPMEVYDDKDPKKPTVELTICDSISGGAQETWNMPNQLSLKKLKLVNGKWKEFDAVYALREVNFKNK
jgi:hypothetical protein